MNSIWQLIRNILLWLAFTITFILAAAKFLNDFAPDFPKGLLNSPWELVVILATVVTFFTVVALSSLLFIRRRYENRPQSSGLESEAASAERQVATTAETLTRDFESRINRLIDDAVRRLATTSDEMIKTQLRESINQSIGSNLITVLGERLATETSEVSRLAKFSQETDDVFIGMRNRIVQYAQSANIQSTYFRYIGIFLSLTGLGTLGVILYSNLRQFFEHPDMMNMQANWEMLVARNAPSSAFVALSEFLALIMFRYQSKSLEYMRYFSNEATNLDARKIAFMSALYFSDKKAIGRLIDRFEMTERNFLIGKDQRTLELANNVNEDMLFDRLRKYISVNRSDDSVGETPAAAGPKKGAKAHK